MPASNPPLPDSYRAAALHLARQGGPRMLLLLLAALLAARLAAAPWALADTLVIGGAVALRGVIEWLLHAYVWHARPLPLLRVSLPNAIARLHAEHHRHPHDLATLVFGWRNILLATLALLALAALLLPWPLALSSVFALLLVTALYEWCHLVAHTHIRPRSAAFRRLIANHRHHHFRDAGACLGVSSVLGDRLLGTARAGDGDVSRERPA